ncbi:MAG: hypothetical protein ACR2KU_14195 [Gammaproteobacteria bacterium]|nr:hypothetical protein [Gammaproteobacteria bacterium]
MNTVVLSVALLGLMFLALSVARLRRRRIMAASGHAVVSALLLASGVLLGAVAVNLRTYPRLTYEQPVAELAFARRGARRFGATIDYPDGTRNAFVLDGDEWQLDARVLKWKGFATVLGLDARYRLERLSGRHRDLGRARNGPHSVYPLSADVGLNLWNFAQGHKRWIPCVDATYGTAIYLPMADRARYSVRLTPSGLIGRPLNAPARYAVSRWR